MGLFFIDDSVHDEQGFIIGACVYTNSDTIAKLDKIYNDLELSSDIAEYKSGLSHSKFPKLVEVREKLIELLSNYCKLGIVIVPRSERDNFGVECIKAISQFSKCNTINDFEVYFDEGMFNSIEKAENLKTELGMCNSKFHLEQDSKKIRGIQLADLAAHCASIQLKDAMGLISKKVKAPNESGYDLNEDIELGFEMWATLRYVFFKEDNKKYHEDPIINYTFMVEPYGLYISPLCDEKLTVTAREKFQDVYLGCIH